MVLTNQESSEAFQAIVHHVLDHHLGAKGTDWVKTYRVLAGRQQGRPAKSRKKAMAARNPRPARRCRCQYAGRYATSVRRRHADRENAAW